MFTGLVDHCAEIVAFEPLSGGGAKVTLLSRFPTDIARGESVSVDGICLTTLNEDPSQLEFELSQETLRCTSAGTWGRGNKVNVERALRLGDRLGGHWVTGHVDAAGTLLDKTPRGDFWEMRFSYPSTAKRWLTPKGSITVNGISLTVNEIDGNGFSVMIIPHTFHVTNLSQIVSGQRVNLEFDWMTKVIVNQIEDRKERLGLSL